MAINRQLVFGIGFLVVVVFFVITKLQFNSFTNESRGKITESSTSSLGSATSGKLFKGLKIRSYSDNVFNHPDMEVAPVSVVEIDSKKLKCARWSVVTTIFEPSEAVKKQALMTDWCLVVVGDRKGPLAYDIVAPSKNFVFLTAAMQEEMSKDFPLITVLPWNHFGRKNIGYLYAILHGATTIWDFDDDNILLTTGNDFEVFPRISDATINTSISAIKKTSTSLSVLEAVDYGLTNQLSFNPYPLMACPPTPCWPRGLPLQDIKFKFAALTLKPTNIPMSSVAVVQSLANQDPDVDAIYRLTQPLPFDFPSTGSRVAVPRGAYAPYNAQATLHLQSALWSLMLPVTVHGRVSDIWRGYVAQRILALLGLRLLFAPSLAKQVRNVHNYMADFDSENDLYIRSMRLLEQLNEWKPSDAAVIAKHPLCACIEEIWIMMYENGYVELGDLDLVHAWLKSLLAAGYKFPALAPGPKAAPQ